MSTRNTIRAVIEVERNCLRSHATSIELTLRRYQSGASALCRGPLSAACACVTLSTGRWRDRKWQVGARLTWQDILVSVFALVFGLLAFFAGIQQFALLLLKNLIAHEEEISCQDDKKQREPTLFNVSASFFFFKFLDIEYNIVILI